jgi:rare lipoprotein A
VSLPALAPLTPAAKRPTQSERGLASWYNAPDRTCAHRSVPKGVIIKVTSTSTGESTTCEVADWGPADTSRVIDLSMDTFELLSHTGAGLMDVVIEW